MRRSASSTTTMAPSTTRPTDMMRPKNTTMFMVMPVMASSTKAAAKEPGIEMPASSAFCRPRMPIRQITTSSTATTTSLTSWLMSSRTCTDLSRL